MEIACAKGLTRSRLRCICIGIDGVSGMGGAGLDYLAVISAYPKNRIRRPYRILRGLFFL